MKKETIEVQFRKLNGEIICVFPYIIEGNTTVRSYMHVGQHSACSWDINSFTKPCSPFEFKSLLDEVRGSYNDYNVTVIGRRSKSKYLKAYREFVSKS